MRWRRSSRPEKISRPARRSEVGPPFLIRSSITFRSLLNKQSRTGFTHADMEGSPAQDPMNKESKSPDDKKKKLKTKKYEKELRKLQAELCHLQEWVKHKRLRVIIVFEGRDGAGKGGTIRAITERVS